MKVTVKLVTSKDPRVVEVGDDATVGDLMEKFGNEFNYDVKALAFKGKNLKDRSQKLVDAGIVENEVCIIVGTKRREAPASSSAPSSSTAPAQAQESQSQPAEAEQKKETERQDAPAPQSEVAATAAGAFVQEDAMDSTVAMIMQMGDWNKDQVMHALRMAFNNPDRAVELLFSGQVPQNPPPAAPEGPASGAPAGAAPAAPAAPSAPAPGQEGSTSPSPGSVEIPGLGTLTLQQFQEIVGILARTNATVNQEAVINFLRQFGNNAPAGAGAAAAGGLSPLAQRLSQIDQWESIRQAVANDRSRLERVLQVLQERDPELYTLIQQNDQEFLRLLQEGIPGQQSGGAGAPGTQTITLTEEDRRAVANLVSLGFTERQALQAYILADKNEEMAANLLFDQGGELGG